MKPDTDLTELFTQWALAEAAAHYVSPCPDEMMDGLTGNISTALEELAATPAVDATGIVLKLLPLVIYAYEPKQGEPPLQPKAGNGLHCDRGLIASLLDDLRRVLPDISKTIAAPAPQTFRNAA